MVKLISFLIGFHYRQGFKTTTKCEVKRNEEDRDEKHIGKLRLERTQR